MRKKSASLLENVFVRTGAAEPTGWGGGGGGEAYAYAICYQSLTSIGKATDKENWKL